MSNETESFEREVDRLLSMFEQSNLHEADINYLNAVPFIVSNLITDISDGKSVFNLMQRVCNTLHQLDYSIITTCND